MRVQFDRADLEPLVNDIAERVAEILAARLPVESPVKPQQEWLGIADAAEFFGVNRHTIRDAITSGELVAYRPGKQWRIKRSDLEKWAAERARQ